MAFVPVCHPRDRPRRAPARSVPASFPPAISRPGRWPENRPRTLRCLFGTAVRGLAERLRRRREIPDPDGRTVLASVLRSV